jgi:hypothetical protein
MSKYRKQVMGYAERAPGVLIQFAGMTGIFELPKSHPSFESFASLLRAAKDSGIPVSFELDGNQIVSVG